MKLTTAKNILSKIKSSGFKIIRDNFDIGLNLVGPQVSTSKKLIYFPKKEKIEHLLHEYGHILDKRFDSERRVKNLLKANKASIKANNNPESKIRRLWALHKIRKGLLVPELRANKKALKLLKLKEDRTSYKKATDIALGSYKTNFVESLMDKTKLKTPKNFHFAADDLLQINNMISLEKVKALDKLKKHHILEYKKTKKHISSEIYKFLR